MNEPKFASPKSTRAYSTFTPRLTNPMCPESPHSYKTLSFSTGKRFLMYSDNVGVVEQTEENKLETEFDVLGVIGEGEFAVVYKCCRKSDGNLSAVKRFKKRHRGVLDRTSNLSEVQYLARLSSGATGFESFILRYLDCWEQRNHLYLQTELCLQSLDQMLAEVGVLEERLLWKLLADITCALKLINFYGLIHLDLKPGNVMIAEDRFKLGDFGHCVEAGEEAEEGDRAYIAPEVLQGKSVYASDVFSLGLILYKCQTPDPLPIEGLPWQRIRNGFLPWCPSVTDTVFSLVSRMIHPDPEKRPDLDSLIAIAEKYQMKEMTSPCTPPPSSALRQAAQICRSAPSVLEIQDRTVNNDHAVNLTEVFRHM